MTATIYHNPRCSKSRATLALLEQHGVTPRVVKYLETPPSPGELESILQQLGMEPQEVIRFSDRAAREAGISRDDDRDAAGWLEVLAEHPGLMQRPIVVNEGRARIGRPPENVLEII